MKKPGPHAPIGSDLIHAREWSLRAAKREHAVVSPTTSTGRSTRRDTSPERSPRDCTSRTRPELVPMDRAGSESGANQKRLALPDLYTAIWWYGGFPNQ